MVKLSSVGVWFYTIKDFIGLENNSAESHLITSFIVIAPSKGSWIFASWYMFKIENMNMYQYSNVPLSKFINVPVRFRQILPLKLVHLSSVNSNLVNIKRICPAATLTLLYSCLSDPLPAIISIQLSDA